ncbi:hypothetical protein LguiA_032321 [Lonicera macranthoides]
MVCLACLLPLFLVPIVNLLPLLFDLIMAKVYRLFGWEYRKPERAPPACPYKPVAKEANNGVAEETKPLIPGPVEKSAGVDEVEHQMFSTLKLHSESCGDLEWTKFLDQNEIAPKDMV